VKLLPLRWLIGCALIAAIGASPVFAHLTDLAPGPPTTYTGAVQRVRETMRGVEEARERSDFPDASLHAGELVVLARQVPALSLSVASALADSAVGRIMLTSTRVGALALAAQQAADRKDAVDLGRQTAEFAALLATLDAYVPKQYVCPMHCEVGRLYDRPGSCPVCGMFLQLVTSDRYSVEVTPKKSPIRARSAVTLDFRVKDPAGFDSRPVGSGRYRFDTWERGSRLVLKRNDDYWGTKGRPQTLVYRAIPDATTRVTELLTGGVDLILPIAPDFIDKLEKTPQVTVHKKTGLTVWYVGFNVDKKPFTDKRVRQAFNHAVNKDAIVRDILKGTGVPAVGPLLPGTWAADPALRKYAYDPAAATRLLTEAGYPNGLEVDFWVPESGSGMQSPVEMSTVIQSNLAAVGVKAPLKTFEWGSYLGKLRSDAPVMFALSWFLKSEDPDLSLYPLFFSKNTPLPNRSNYASPDVDQLLLQARQVADRGKRAELYRKAQQIIVADAPWIFVDHEQQVVATRASVKGFKLHPSGFDLRVENITKD